MTAHPKLSVLAVAVALGFGLACTGTATTTAPTEVPTPPEVPPPAPDKPTNGRTELGAKLFDAAESAHHCSGEEPTDDQRAQQLAKCVEEGRAEALNLLATATDSDLPAGELAVVRLYIDDTLSDDTKRKLCATLGEGDLLPDSLVDDEVRMTACAALAQH